MKGPILLVLAAGMGSRYGGLKQLDPLGPHGETLLDYSIYDAIQAGFSTAVFVIRRSMEQDFNEQVLSRFNHHIDCRIQFQDMDNLIQPDLKTYAAPETRTKPWGTTHAVLCARKAIDRPFAVINADDFYGREAFMAMGTFLSQAEQTRSRDGAMIIYPLYKTLTEAGSVSRGVCSIERGTLVSITEHTKIEQIDGRIVSHLDDAQDMELEPETGVSMNFWGLTPQVFADLTDYFADFIKAHGKDPKKECYLPSAIDYLIHHRGLVIHGLETQAQWFGVTYRVDRERAMERIRALVAAGVYPGPLWG
ncbi:NTP transferase domain-containing protein [Gracilinema caldarium]|uniref:NTP transferase domain-containing protein n=1 Tax=Gracilinema caldarium TaxID=215591 RepID=UPI0026E93F88|nr:NTP transferase domain-containing protein [Gracilinema caldarium]